MGTEVIDGVPLIATAKDRDHSVIDGNGLPPAFLELLDLPNRFELAHGSDSLWMCVRNTGHGEKTGPIPKKSERIGREIPMALPKLA